MQTNTLIITCARIVDRELCHLLGRAIDPVVKRQAALDPRQQQQLLKGAVQAVSSGFGMGQRLFASFAIGHARHLQVGLDRGQRAAQFMGRVAGQAPLALDGLGNTCKQLVLRIEQRFQLAGQR